MLRNAAITGWGWQSPEIVVTNAALSQRVQTSDEWIRARTGIAERRVAGPKETTSSLCTQAATKALAQADLDPRDLDLILCATTTPDYLLPATACLIQERIGATRAGACDLNAACCGFLYALTIGTQFIQAGTMRRILIVAGETLSRFTDYTDRNTCILFGDAGAAVLLEATTQSNGVLSTVLGSRGDVDRMLSIDAGCGAQPATAQTVAEGAHYIRMRGNEVFKLAVRHMVQAAREALHKAQLTVADMHTIIPHQANLRIISATQQSLEIPADKLFLNVDRHGNTGAASIPLALGELAAKRPLSPGDNLLTVAFGGGLTWAAAIIRWADIAAIRRERTLRSAA